MASVTSSANDSFELFPGPTRTQSASLSPRVWPGATPATTTALKKILGDNHERWHIFMNSMGFHNHAAHHALALWALGADESILNATYEENCKEQRAMFSSPGSISDENWKAQLGDEKYYQAYLDFFANKVKTVGVDAVLEEYIFATSANMAPGDSNQPVMLNRFLEGLLHPMIHVGYGLEFGLPGMLIEGLAQTAVHRATAYKLVPDLLFDGGAGLADDFVKAVKFDDKDGAAKKPVHAMSILARILADPQFVTAKPVNAFAAYTGTVENLGEAIRKYADQWTLEGPIEEKVEELVWVNALIYGVGGWEGPVKTMNADFVQMHLVTSSIFISSIVAHLTRRSQELLLRAYFVICLTWYIGNGRADIDIDGFFDDADRAYPTPPGALPSPHSSASPSQLSSKAVTPNPWLSILQTTLVHPDDHIPKLQRALAHYAEVYGGREAGYFSGVELKGANKLDGSLFLRIAGLTTERIGWIREGEGPLNGTWDRRGFYKHAL